MVFVILYVVYFIIMFQNVRISKYVRPFLERHLFCFKKKVYDLDNIKEVTVENGNVPNVAPKLNNNHIEDSKKMERYQSHTNGYINNSFVVSNDDKLQKMQEPTIVDPEYNVPFHGHVPSKSFIKLDVVS